MVSSLSTPGTRPFKGGNVATITLSDHQPWKTVCPAGATITEECSCVQRSSLRQGMEQQQQQNAPSFVSLWLFCTQLTLVEPSLKPASKGACMYSLQGHREGRTQVKNSLREGEKRKEQHEKESASLLRIGFALDYEIVFRHLSHSYIQSNLVKFIKYLQKTRPWTSISY